MCIGVICVLFIFVEVPPDVKRSQKIPKLTLFVGSNASFRPGSHSFPKKSHDDPSSGWFVDILCVPLCLHGLNATNERQELPVNTQGFAVPQGYLHSIYFDSGQQIYDWSLQTKLALK